MGSGYTETYAFASKRVRLRVWRLLWVIAATVGLEKFYGIRCARRYVR